MTLLGVKPGDRSFFLALFVAIAALNLFCVYFMLNSSLQRDPRRTRCRQCHHVTRVNIRSGEPGIRSRDSYSNSSLALTQVKGYHDTGKGKTTTEGNVDGTPGGRLVTHTGQRETTGGPFADVLRSTPRKAGDLAITKIVRVLPNHANIPSQLQPNRLDGELKNLVHMDEKSANKLHQASLLQDDLILSPSSCEKDTFLLIIMVSATAHFRRRAEVRDVVKFEPYREKRVRFAFATSKEDDHNTNAKLRNESLKFKDIIQTNHKEAYRNLTFKALEILKWTVAKCRHAKFFLKIDDDVLIIYQNIVEYVIGLEANNTTFVYAGGYASPNLKPNRDPKSMSYISPVEFKNKTFPPYVSGFAILFSQDAVRDIYLASFHVPRVYSIPRQTFPIDDAFIGICAKYAKIKKTSIPWMCLEWPTVETAVKRDRCSLVKLKLVHVHGVSGYGKTGRYLKQLQNMTVTDMDACQKKKSALSEYC